MTIQLTGKNIETSPSLQSYVEYKIGLILDKYIGPEIGGHVRVEKERGRFRTHCSIRLKTGLMLEAVGEGNDAYASADAATERLEKRVRRYKRRLKNHHDGVASDTLIPETSAPDYVLQLNTEDDETDTVREAMNGSHAPDLAPVIVAETTRTLPELSVGQAVLQLDLTDRSFLIFRNAGHGGLNVVYRRGDGNVGWVDPAVDPGRAGQG
jgi:ribosomal subunit interface protein